MGTCLPLTPRDTHVMPAIHTLSGAALMAAQQALKICQIHHSGLPMASNLRPRQGSNEHAYTAVQIVRVTDFINILNPTLSLCNWH